MQDPTARPQPSFPHRAKPAIPAARRAQYADELSALCGLTDPALKAAFASVPREAFLPPGPWLIEAADASVYRSDDDDPAHILHGVGVVLDQERSLHCASPARVGRALQAARLKPGNTVLHVGAGLGYFSALMAELAGPAGRIIAAEIDPHLAATARRNLDAYTNVEVTGDALSYPVPPLDVVFASCGMATIPRGWLRALKPNGRMILPLTGSVDGGNLFVIGRSPDPDRFHVASLGLVHFYPCSGLRDPDHVAAVDAAMTNGRGLSVRHLRLDRHSQNRDCWLHMDDWCLTAAL
jgi:protein-L-isoaspartate(D-aspartate) O-methyltransferase